MNDGQRQHDPGIELADAFQEFLLLADTPDAVTLETMVSKYPKFASELTDFAIEWAMQDLLPQGDLYPVPLEADDEAEADGLPASAMSSAVSSAMERLYDGLDHESRSPDSNPFADRSPADLKRLGNRLGIDKTLVAKLRDRRIEADSVPGFLCEQLADELEVPLGAVVAHLQAPPILSFGASFKATGKPEAVGKESFARAVERSQLGAGDKKRLLDADSDGD